MCVERETPTQGNLSACTIQGPRTTWTLLAREQHEEKMERNEKKTLRNKREESMGKKEKITGNWEKKNYRKINSVFCCCTSKLCVQKTAHLRWVLTPPAWQTYPTQHEVDGVKDFSHASFSLTRRLSCTGETRILALFWPRHSALHGSLRL